MAFKINVLDLERNLLEEIKKRAEFLFKNGDDWELFLSCITMELSWHVNEKGIFEKLFLKSKKDYVSNKKKKKHKELLNDYIEDLIYTYNNLFFKAKTFKFSDNLDEMFPDIELYDDVESDLFLITTDKRNFRINILELEKMLLIEINNRINNLEDNVCIDEYLDTFNGSIVYQEKFGYIEKIYFKIDILKLKINSNSIDLVGKLADELMDVYNELYGTYKDIWIPIDQIGKKFPDVIISESDYHKTYTKYGN